MKKLIKDLLPFVKNGSITIIALIFICTILIPLIIEGCVRLSKFAMWFSEAIAQ